MCACMCVRTSTYVRVHVCVCVCLREYARVHVCACVPAPTLWEEEVMGAHCVTRRFQQLQGFKRVVLNFYFPVFC